MPLHPLPNRAARSPRRVAAGPLLAAAVLAAACTTHYLPPAVDQAEVEAARQAIAAPAWAAAARDPTLADTANRLATVTRRVSDAAQPLCTADLGRTCPLEVVLDPSAAPRAEATGRGRILVTAGMVRLLDGDDELAAVVAHEAGHHLAGHIGRQLARGLAAGTVASALLGAVLPFGGLAGWALGQGAAELGAGAARLAFSKEEEREADYLAAYLVARAGYDPERAGRLWEILGRGRAGESAGLLDSHPAGPDRLAAWRRTAEEIRVSPDLVPRGRAAGDVLHGL
jgi:predicted Zn-dependent protease